MDYLILETHAISKILYEYLFVTSADFKPILIYQSSVLSVSTYLPNYFELKLFQHKVYYFMLFVKVTKVIELKTEKQTIGF